ncbi:gamma-interferon-responsive lysosomal thiol protein-like [Corylus avellana]|uniref:gamma-interferon-responsive lysosomal thiol protein-like n=1 Tax=Corylus avellana TaxID=13451 RepID=UPI001E23B347|nr:gamma-interferon-responsive lysosomal thiol protein-like [Corylus avellana]
MAASRQLFTTLVLATVLLSFTTRPAASSPTSDSVTVSLYYETLCPYCANFIVNYLLKIFQNGLISVVNLRMVPWGNAWIQSNGTFVCQHGSDECLLNTIEACTITVYPDVVRHFRFIYCVERLALNDKHSEWINCFEKTGLGTVPINCYNSGYGNKIEQKYARETAQLNPRHRFVPWVVVNNQALQEDYGNFMTYICKAYKGKSKPEACKSLSPKSESTEKANFVHPVCYADEAQNLTSLTAAEKIP